MAREAGNSYSVPEPPRDPARSVKDIPVGDSKGISGLQSREYHPRDPFIGAPRVEREKIEVIDKNTTVPVEATPKQDKAQKEKVEDNGKRSETRREWVPPEKVNAEIVREYVAAHGPSSDVAIQKDTELSLTDVMAARTWLLEDGDLKESDVHRRGHKTQRFELVTPEEREAEVSRNDAERIKAMLGKKDAAVTMGEIRHLAGLDENRAQNVLNTLFEQGEIEAVGYKRISASEKPVLVYALNQKPENK